MPKLLLIATALVISASSPSHAVRGTTCAPYMQACVALCRGEPQRKTCRPQGCRHRLQICEANRCWPSGSGVCVPLADEWNP